MAKQVLTDAYFLFAGGDLSAFVLSISLPFSVESKDQATMGATTRTFLPGLKNWSIDVEFAQDWANGGLDDTLFANLGVASAFEIRPSKTAAVGVNNPKFTGSAFLESYEPVTGAVGELAKTRAKFVPTTALARAEA